MNFNWGILLSGFNKNYQHKLRLHSPMQCIKLMWERINWICKTEIVAGPMNQKLPIKIFENSQTWWTDMSGVGDGLIRVVDNVDMETVERSRHHMRHCTPAHHQPVTTHHCRQRNNFDELSKYFQTMTTCCNHNLFLLLVTRRWDDCVSEVSLAQLVLVDMVLSHLDWPEP